GARPLGRRAQAMGTFAVTSLGHRPVDGVFSIGGTPITPGLGRTLDRPGARDRAGVVAPLMRLGLTLHHPGIDRAPAGRLLAAIPEARESSPTPEPVEPPVPVGASATGAVR